jgi:hypothetical protein
MNALKILVWVLIIFIVSFIIAFAEKLTEEAIKKAEHCAICHNIKSHVESYLNGRTLDNVHKQASVGCKDCHVDYTLWKEIKSAYRYISGNDETVLFKRKFPQTMCTRCHISIEYLAVKTDFLPRNPHESHFPELECGQCHRSHEKQIDYCSRCHDNGGQRMTGEKPKERNLCLEGGKI